MNRILVGIIFFLFITTGYISFLLHERQEDLQKLNHYKDSWSVSQMVFRILQAGVVDQPLF